MFVRAKFLKIFSRKISPYTVTAVLDKQLSPIKMMFFHWEKHDHKLLAKFMKFCT